MTGHWHNFSCKSRVGLSHKANNIIADDLAKQGASESTVMAEPIIPQSSFQYRKG